MATLKDVAKEAGLTVTTVSRVLNNRGYISEDARNRVEAAMKKLHYQPNEVARSLHAKSSNTIGLIVPHIRHPYFASMISSIEKAAYENGYKLLLCNSQDIKEKEQEYIDICTSNRVAGLVLFSGTVDVSAFKNLDIPVITMERFLDSGTASVECDNEQGGELAANELIGCGCRKILMIGSTKLGELELPADKRSYSFDRVCKKQGIEVIEIYPDNESYTRMDYSGLLGKELKKHMDIDGIFASSDVIAAQALGECTKLGLRVPEDVKIVGFDDTLIARVVTPGITTIHQPIEEMAELAIRLLKEATEGKLVPRQSVLPVRLVKRESTGRI